MMKQPIVIAIVSLFFIITATAHGAPSSSSVEKSLGGNPKDYQRIYFHVTGTDCPVCLGRIEKKLRQARGVVDAAVWKWSPYSGYVVLDERKSNWQDVLQAIEDEHVQLQVEKEGPSMPSGTSDSGRVEGQTQGASRGSR